MTFSKNVNIRKIVIVICSVAFLSALCYNYFIQVIPQKELELNQRGFRILSRLDQNIRDKRNDVLFAVDMVYSKQPYEVRSNRAAFEGLEPTTEKMSKADWKKLYGDKDTLKVIPIYDRYKNQWVINFFGADYPRDKDNSALISFDKNSVRRYRYPADKFFDDLLDYRHDFFEEYMVVYRNHVLYQTKDLVHGATLVTDSTKRPENDCTLVDTYSGTNYKVFLHPMNAASDTQLYICGLISDDEYNRHKYSLESDWVIWISMALLIGLFTVPFFKMIMVSKFERINYSDVIKMCVALVAGGAVLVAVFLIWLLSTVEFERQRRLLKNVNETIALRLNSELTDIVNDLTRQECILQMQMPDKKSDYSSWISQNISSRYDTDSDKLNKYFNTNLAQHHTGALHFIEDTLVWANWTKGGRLYPDIVFGRSTYPSLVFSDPRYLFALHGTTLNEQFGFQVINAWSSQRNSILVSKKPEKITRDLISKFSKELTQSLRDTKKNMEASPKAQGKKVPIPIPPTVNLDVLALETKLFSVTEAALPSEIKFAILDPDGNVLFHSDSKRNLRENFIEECDQQNLVRMAIQSRMDTTLTVLYFGNYHEASFSAVQGMPFTVVTLYDSTAYLDSLINGATFTLTMLLILTLIIALIFVMSLILTRRPTLLRRQTVNLKWIRLTALNLQVCKRLLSVLLVILIASWILSYIVTASLFLAFSIPIITVALTGGIIYAYNEQRYDEGLYTSTIAYQFRTFFALCTVAQLVNFFIALAGPAKDRWQVYSLGAFTLVTLLLLVIHPGIFRNLPSNLELLRRAIFDPEQFFRWRLSRRFRLFERLRPVPAESATGIDNMLVPNKGRYIVTAIMLLVIDVSVVPTAMFFSNAANQEVHVVEKRNAMELAQNIEGRQVWLMSNFPESATDFDRVNDTTLLGSGVYTMENDTGDYVLLNKAELLDEIGKARKRDIASERRSELIREVYARIINAPNFDWDKREAVDMFTHRNFADDPTHFWWWNPTTEKRRLLYCYPSHYPSQSHSGVLIELSMFKSPYDIVTLMEWIGFGIAAFTLLYLIYKVLFFTYKKITLLEFFNCTTVNQIRNADRNFIDNIFASMDNTNLIVIALPGTDVESMIVNKLPGYIEDPRVLLTKNIPHKIYVPSNQRSGIEVIVLSYIDLSGLDDLATALKDFSTLLEDPARKIIWITSVDPCEQVTALGRRMIAAAKESGTAGDATADKFRVERENLLRILDDFKKINYRLEKNIVHSYSAAISIAHVEEEFAYGAYFRRLREDVINSGTLKGYYRSNEAGEIYQKIDERSDDLFVLKIQDMAQNYYYSVWSTLSSREKYVLFDIAHDELTNHKNYSTLVELERKGILYFDSSENALKIFNKSFRNFILTVVNPEEALMLEREINTAGTWDVIRTIMIVFVIAAATFLFVMEKWFYNQLAVIIAAVAVIGPTTMTFFNTGLKSLWTKKEA